MSSPLFSTARGSLVAFAPRNALRNDAALVLKRLAALPKLAGVAPASRLEVRSPAEMVSSGISEIDELTGGLPRGCLSQICGAASSGRTSVLLAALAAATRREEVCALVDTTDALDAVSAAAAGVDLERLLWVRCGKAGAGLQTSDFGLRASDLRLQTPDFGPRTSGSDSETSNPEILHSEIPEQRSGGRSLKSRAQNPTVEARRAKSHFRHLEQALRVTDLLLQSGGFGMVAVDLGDVPHAAARRMPLASWFRFQRTIEPTPTVLLVVVQEPCAQTCASLLIRLQSGKRLSSLSYQLSVKSELWPAHAQLLDGLQIEGELLRSRLQRKPSQSVTTAFVTNPVRIA